jgi:hypothetical protein
VVTGNGAVQGELDELAQEALEEYGDATTFKRDPELKSVLRSLWDVMVDETKRMGGGLQQILRCVVPAARGEGAGFVADRSCPFLCRPVRTRPHLWGCCRSNIKNAQGIASNARSRQPTVLDCLQPA